jgi:hypothetical protein
VLEGWVTPQASLDYTERTIKADLAEMRGQ